MERGGQPGNQNATKNRDWTSAIKRALARKGDGDYHQGLNSLADQIIEKAESGDMTALKEIGDRLEGKPAQIIAGDSDAPLVFEKIVREIVDPANPDR